MRFQGFLMAESGMLESTNWSYLHHTLMLWRQRARRSSTDVRENHVCCWWIEPCWATDPCHPMSHRTTKWCSFWSLFLAVSTVEIWRLHWLQSWMRYMKEVIRSLQAATQNGTRQLVFNRHSLLIFGCDSLWFNHPQYDHKWVAQIIPKRLVYDT